MSTLTVDAIKNLHASHLAIQALSEDEINARLLELLVKPGLALLRRTEPLPYCFDLFHDVKEWYEIDNILDGKPHCSDLGADELRKFAAERGYLIDHPATSSFTKDWTAAGKVLSDLYTNNRLSVSATDDGVQASCVANGYYHVFKDAQPLVAAMRCAIVAYRKEA